MALMIIHYMWHLIRYLSYVILHKAALTLLEILKK